ncbi:MAG: hypothetical protein M3O70_09425 [Actinomycetota bacterium]|nr:hypothetical protein [Actinomycetota bacterium]
MSSSRQGGAHGHVGWISFEQLRAGHLQLEYPEPPTADVVDDYHGRRVASSDRRGQELRG